MLTPVIILNSSPDTWVMFPLPPDAMLSLPGVAPVSDIKDLSSHTHDKATSGHKEQFRTVTHHQGAQSRFLPEYLKHGAPHGHRCSVKTSILFLAVWRHGCLYPREMISHLARGNHWGGRPAAASSAHPACRRGATTSQAGMLSGGSLSSPMA